jgi:ureidoglycolate lyase
MMVLGKRRVDFVVTEFVNGVPQDDCQDVRVGDGVNVFVVEKMYGDDGMAKL